MSQYYEPWRIRYSQRRHRPGSAFCRKLHSEGVECKDGGNGQHIAEDTSYAWDIVSSEGEIVAALDENGYVDTDDGMPIACLVAAAPTLYEALKALMPLTWKYAKQDKALMAAWCLAQGALDKAEGR